jgi:hypothetical protein
MFLLHVLQIKGIGTLWESTGTTGPETANCPYLGPNAKAEFFAISGCDVVPTENTGVPGDGTFCGHWDEECMGNELMTGFLNSGTGENPLSRITVASLKDLGYVVDYTNVDSYTRNNLNANCLCNRRRSLTDRIHGDTHQLGLRIRGTQRRLLSDEVYNMAISYGKAILSKNQQFGSLFTKDGTDSEVLFVGDQVVSVFVEDNGAFFDVAVR